VSCHCWATTGEESPIDEDAAVCSTMELLPGHSPSGTFRVEVTNELVAEFHLWEELCLRLEGPGMRIYDLLLGPQPSQAR
jgi:hypothetical protein